MTKQIEKIPFWVRTLIIPFLILAILPLLREYLMTSRGDLINKIISKDILAQCIASDVLFVIISLLTYFVIGFFICYLWRKPSKHNSYRKTALILAAMEIPAIFLHGLAYDAFTFGPHRSLLEFSMQPAGLNGTLLGTILAIVANILGNIVIPIIFCLIIKKKNWFGGEAAEWLPLTKKNGSSAKVFAIILAIAGFVGVIFTTLLISFVYELYFRAHINVTPVINTLKFIQNLFTVLYSIYLYRIFLSAPTEKAVPQEATAEN